jgi:hypothetical protein
LNYAAGQYCLLVEAGDWMGVKNYGSAFITKEVKQTATTTFCNCGCSHKLPQCTKVRNEVVIQQNKDKFGTRKKSNNKKKGKENVKKDDKKPGKWAKPKDGEPTRKKIFDYWYNYDKEGKRWAKEETSTGPSAANVAGNNSQDNSDLKEANTAMKFYNAMKAMKNMSFDD